MNIRDLKITMITYNATYSYAMEILYVYNAKNDAGYMGHRYLYNKEMTSDEFHTFKKLSKRKQDLLLKRWGRTAG